jgi:2-phospho-L-lactate guanylyltransferase
MGELRDGSLNKWQALVPIKQGVDGKSRLAGVLSDADRLALVSGMAAHVLQVLGQCQEIAGITILSPTRPAGWLGGWQIDQGRGLNQELSQWRAGLAGAPALVIHADLPLLAAADISALLDMATQHQAAMATDRVGQGTNALALSQPDPFEYCFGPMSRSLHSVQRPTMPVLERLGLMADLDTPEDLLFARAHGLVMP